MNWAPAHVPERELREIFLLPFEAAIKTAGLASVMNAYHELDGVPCGASRWLLTDVLRGRLGFDGLVVSDYFTVPMSPRGVSPRRGEQGPGRAAGARGRHRAAQHQLLWRAAARGSPSRAQWIWR